MSIVLGDVVKLALAIVIGGLIGAEREYRHRAAGFRTIIFITLGATLFTLFSLRLGGATSPVRIAAHLVTGVGFICAGVIMEQGAQVVGLTTAATIWLTAAIGMGIGGEQYGLVILATGAVVVILLFFPRLEQHIYMARDMRTYEVTSEVSNELVGHLMGCIEDCNLEIAGSRLTKVDGHMTSIWNVYGPPEQHDQLVDKLLSDPQVMAFHY